MLKNNNKKGLESDWDTIFIVEYAQQEAMEDMIWFSLDS